MKEEPILFAGITSWWHDPKAGEDAGWHLTTTMLTMDSYGPMQPIHDRIPVFLDDQMQRDWLSPRVEGSLELMEAVAASSRDVGQKLVEYEVAPLKGEWA